jgi:phage major head subunit gpT-like protein
MAIALGNIYNLLQPGLMSLPGEYNNIPSQWKQVFKTVKSNMSVERSTSLAFLPLAQKKTEGSSTHFANTAGQRYTYNMESIEVGLAYAITRKAIADNLYKTSFRPTNLGLIKSFDDFWEMEAAGIFNGAGTAITGLGGDGQALLSTAHPVDGYNIGNTTTVALDLNEASLLSSMTAIRRNFRNEAGLKIKARARRLIIPPELEATAIRLTKTELRPGTAQNDVNAILSLSGGLPEPFLVLDYLTSAYSWFLKTDIDGLIYLDRESFETDMQVDFTTDNLLVKGYQRGGFFYNDWRSVYGQQPTS